MHTQSNVNKNNYKGVAYYDKNHVFDPWIIENVSFILGADEIDE